MNKTNLNLLDTKTFDILRGREWRNLQEGDELTHPCFLGLDPILHKYALVSGENFAANGREGAVEFQSEDLMIEPHVNINTEEHGALLCFSPDFLDSLLLTEKIEHTKNWVDRVKLYGGHVFLVKTKGIQDN